MILWTMLTVIVLMFVALTLLNVLFWPRILRRDLTRDKTYANKLSVLIPARNEAKTIEACLRSVLDQGDIVGEVLVYDDCSTDDTATRVLGLRQTDQRVRLITGKDLPSGWCGKTHACMQLAGHAQSPWMLFLDADARLQPGGAAALVHTAEKRNLSLLSGWPGFELQTMPEQLLMPMLNFLVFTLFPAVGSLVSNHPQLGLAHGVCILVDRLTYLRLGGHSLVRTELFEDTVLARRWREHGERSLCLDGQNIVRVRMYSSLISIWEGFQKNFYPGFHSNASFWTFLGLHFFLYLAPFLSLPFLNSGEAAVFAFIAVLGVLAMRLLLALRFRQPLWSVPLHPFAEAFLIVLGIRSWWRWSHGSGVQWKDRLYSPRTAEGIAKQ